VTKRDLGGWLVLVPRSTDLGDGRDVEVVADGAGDLVDGPAAGWATAGHLASPAYEPALEAVRRARSFVRTSLEAVGLDDCADDAGLLVSELAANAVLHARTPFAVHLRPTLEGGVRVEVHDRSPLPPVHTAHSASATSGRGLDLVATMATRWGSHPVADGEGGDGAARPWTGKSVWFEVEATTAAPVADTDTQELLALWTDGEEAFAPGTGGSPPTPSEGIITGPLPAQEPEFDVLVPDLPVAELLAAEEAVEDLLRELQLLLLAPTAAGVDADVDDAAAARLDRAAREFEQGRRQVREQVTSSAARGEASMALHLRLPASARSAAERYREAVATAEDLYRDGPLLTAPEAGERHAEVHLRYLDEVVRQLPAES